MLDTTKQKDGYASRYSSSVGIRDGLTFLLVGGGIGAVLALLFAPKSGGELRGDIADVTRRGYEATLEKANDLKALSEEKVRLIRDKADTVYDFAAAKLSAGNDAVSDAVSAASEAVSDGLAKVHQETQPSMRHAGAPRKSASIF